MATTTIASLLQAAALLLVGMRGAGGRIPVATAERAVYLAGNAVQIAAQAEAAPHFGFVVAQNDGVWPNMRDLANAPYRDGSGRWVRLGQGVTLVEGDTSFGDLNHDGLDDAAVVVDKRMPGGSREYFLAAMLNQGGIMFDVAEVPLGSDFVAVSHGVKDGEIFENGSRYRLLGDELERIII